jgi:hypothetical protein
MSRYHPDIGAACCRSNPDRRKEFAAQDDIPLEGAKHPGGDRRNTVFAHAAGGHACMDRLDHHAHPSRPQYLVDDSGDLRRHALLDLKTPGEAIHHPGELGNPDDAIGRQVADMHHAGVGAI